MQTDCVITFCPKCQLHVTVWYMLNVKRPKAETILLAKTLFLLPELLCSTNHLYPNVPRMDTCHCYKISHDVISLHVITLQSKGKHRCFPFQSILLKSTRKHKQSLGDAHLCEYKPRQILYSQSRFTWLNNLRGTRQSWQQRQSVWRPILPIKTLHGRVSKSFKMGDESTNDGNMLIHMKEKNPLES